MKRKPNPYTKVIFIRTTPEHANSLRAKAIEANITLAEYIRKRLGVGSAKCPKPSPVEPASSSSSPSDPLSTSPPQSDDCAATVSPLQGTPST